MGGEATAAEAYELFRAQRHRAVTGPRGALALVLTHYVTDAQRIDGVPGIWAPSPAGDGLTVSATAGESIYVDGSLVDGEATVFGSNTLAPSSVLFDERRTATVVRDAVAGFALRVWDAASPAVQRFVRLSRWEFDPAWVQHGRFEAVDGGVEFSFAKTRGGERTAVSPGIVHWEYEGQSLQLRALPDGHALQIVFADSTTGAESYDVGRFLWATPAADGTVELDFNRSVVPPCSMSDQFNCPMPPLSNRLPFAVRAGEQRPVWL